MYIVNLIVHGSSTVCILIVFQNIKYLNTVHRVKCKSFKTESETLVQTKLFDTCNDLFSIDYF